jgi:hypothetical protein
MRFIVSVCIMVLFGSFALFAQEETGSAAVSDTAAVEETAGETAPAPEVEVVRETVPDAPAEAAEPASSPVPEPAQVAVPAHPAVKPPEKEGIKTVFYGMAMYRFRWIAYANFRKDEGIETAQDYQNKLAYKAGVKVKVNDEVSGRFEAGNDWYGTETVEAVTKGNLLGSHRNIYPYFSLACMTWNPGCFFVDVGIIPVAGSSMLDLIGSGFAADKESGTAYQKAAHTSWGIITNFSIPGVRLGVPVLKEEFKLGVELVTSVLEERSITASIPDSLLNNNSAVMLMVDFPMSRGPLTVKPGFLVNFNRFYRDSGSAAVAVREKADHEYGFGVEAGYKVSDAACVRLGLGYAHMSNENTMLPGQAAVDEEGVDGNIGITLNMWPGTFNFDFTLSTDQNNRTGNGRVYYPFVDVKYALKVNKNFTIMPRTRLFFTRAAENDGRYITKFTTWPELIMYGSF